MIRWLLSLFTTLDSPPYMARSPKWPAVRKAWLERHPTCAACGTKESLAVHHIKPVHLSPERELDASNLLTLCEKPTRNCHCRLGHSLDWQAWNPHAVEDSAMALQRVQLRKYSL